MNEAAKKVNANMQTTTNLRTFPMSIEKDDTSPQISRWHNFLVRAGILMTSAKSNVEPPRLNPTVIALGSFLLATITALMLVGMAWGRQGGQMEFYQFRIEQLEKQNEEMKKEFQKQLDYKQVDIDELKDRLNKVELKTERKR